MVIDVEPTTNPNIKKESTPTYLSLLTSRGPHPIHEGKKAIIRSCLAQLYFTSEAVFFFA
jgi:hypothetical protein